MMTTSIHRSFIILFILTLLTACTSKEKIEQSIVGIWEGKDETRDVRWCAKYADNNQLSLISHVGYGKMKHQYPEDGGLIIEQEGVWNIAEGRRLFINTADVRQFYVPLTATKPEAKSLTSLTEEIETKLNQRGYLLKSITDESMYYRSIDEPDRWFRSKRVEKCSSIFFPEDIPSSS